MLMRKHYCTLNLLFYTKLNEVTQLKLNTTQPHFNIRLWCGLFRLVAKLSTLVAVLCKKMRYYFPSKSVTLELPRKHPIIH